MVAHVKTEVWCSTKEIALYGDQRLTHNFLPQKKQRTERAKKAGEIRGVLIKKVNF
jgi:hypothetical protein